MQHNAGEGALGNKVAARLPCITTGMFRSPLYVTPSLMAELIENARAFDVVERGRSSVEYATKNPGFLIQYFT